MYQNPLFTSVTSEWKPPALSSLPSWADAKRVGIDCETRDPQLRTLGPGVGRRPNSYIAGISFAFEDGPKFYLPIRHEGGDNLPVHTVIGYLRAQAKAFKGDLVGANLPYDLDALATGDGVHFPNVRFFRDVQVADPLINELHDRYNLDAILARWGMEGKNEDLLRRAAVDYGIDPKAEMWRLPARFVGPYAEDDAAKPLRLLRRQERAIDEQELWPVYDLESRLLPVLTKMRRRGVLIDQDRLRKIEEWTLAQEREALEKVRHLTGVAIRVGDVWKPEALAPALERIGVTLKRTSTGKVSIDKELLSGLDHDVARALASARKVNKLRTTFAASIWEHMVNGRIHCTFNQLRRAKDDEADGEGGAKYGRLSAEHPNLQQQPARDEFAKMWRSIYLPEPGAQWASADYSQQEPRWAVHYGCVARREIGQAAWEAAIHARNQYRNDPSTDNHQMMADMAGVKRKEAKEIYLGLSYGMGGAKMCRKLGLPTRMVVSDPRTRVNYDVESDQGRILVANGARRYEAAGLEGQSVLDRFDAKVPFIKKLAKACEARAKACGYITTIGGRRCRFPVDEHGNYDWTHKGFNRLIQGSSADQTKQSMVDCDAAGYDIIIQVHDENAFNVQTETEAQGAAEIMRNCIPAQLPFKVDVEIGPSWGESMS